METRLGQPEQPWSGDFWTDEEDQFGYLSITHDDDRQHFPPEGWTLVKSLVDDDATVFIYRRVCDTCPSCIDSGDRNACLNCPYT